MLSLLCFSPDFPKAHRTSLFPELYSKNQTTFWVLLEMEGLVLICSLNNQGHYPSLLNKPVGCCLDPAHLHIRGCAHGLNFCRPNPTEMCPVVPYGDTHRPCVVQSYISGHVVTIAKSSPVIYPLLCPFFPLSHPSLALLCLENRPAASPTARPSSPNTACAESLLGSETYHGLTVSHSHSDS